MTVNAPEKKTAERQQTLEGITLTNGQARTFRRSEELEPLIKKICDVIAQGRNVLFSDDVEISINIEPAAGSAAFTLSVDGLALLISYACWDAAVSSKLWEVSDGLFLKLVEMNGAQDCGYQYREAPTAPWFTTMLLPQFESISEKHQSEIGILEPCIVFALWDSERSSDLAEV